MPRWQLSKPNYALKRKRGAPKRHPDKSWEKGYQHLGPDETRPSQPARPKHPTDMATRWVPTGKERVGVTALSKVKVKQQISSQAKQKVEIYNKDTSKKVTHPTSWRPTTRNRNDLISILVIMKLEQFSLRE